MIATVLRESNIPSQIAAMPIAKKPPHVVWR